MTDARFSKRVRLLKPAEFRQVFGGSPLRCSDKMLTVLAIPNDLPYSRLGLAIAKKSVRRAVDRNRVKRLVREHFRLHAEQIPPVDIVVMARHAIVSAENADIASALNNHWGRIAKKLG